MNKRRNEWMNKTEKHKVRVNYTSEGEVIWKGQIVKTFGVVIRPYFLLQEGYPQQFFQ